MGVYAKKKLQKTGENTPVFPLFEKKFDFWQKIFVRSLEIM